MADRIDKILSNQGIASRSEVRKLVKQKRVTVNGTLIRRPEEKADPEKDEIAVDGKTINYKKHLYIMMNKPAGVLSASRDNRAETVIDLLPPELRRDGLFPAGRLDKDTTGFIFLTDDGELAHSILSPKRHVYKLYEAKCDRELTEQDVLHFAKGITVGEQSFLPAKMKIIAPDTALVEICEGKFHQVRLMFRSAGTEVISLKRVRIGGVYLDKNLAEGGYREMTENEIKAIKSIKEELY